MLSAPALSDCRNSANVVLQRSPESCGADPGRPMRANDVWFPKWSSMSPTATRAPCSSAAKALAMPAVVRS